MHRPLPEMVRGFLLKEMHPEMFKENPLRNNFKQFVIKKLPQMIFRFIGSEFSNSNYKFILYLNPCKCGIYMDYNIDISILYDIF